MRYFKKIIGERIYLSPMNTDDAEIYVKWLSDYDVTNFLNSHARVLSLNAERKWLEENSGGPQFAIVLLENDTLIGNIGLHNVDQLHRNAEVGLFIGERENRGKGYGTEAMHLILDFGFNTLNLHNIMLKCHADNEAGLKSYKKVGFREFGRRREDCFKGGRYVDTVFMDILNTEFR